jgi:hypothetical protein
MTCQKELLEGTWLNPEIRLDCFAAPGNLHPPIMAAVP